MPRLLFSFGMFICLSVCQDLAYDVFLVFADEHAVLGCSFAAAEVVKCSISKCLRLVVYNVLDSCCIISLYTAEHEHAVGRQSECELLVDVDSLALGETLQGCLVVEWLCEDNLARDVSRNLQSLTQSESD